MDIKEIKQVIDLMKKSELTEFRIEEQGLKLYLKRGQGGEPLPYPPPHMAAYPPPPPPAAQAGTPPTQETPAPAEKEGTLVRSPMVGTFYRSPSPESKPFVEPGDTVGEDTVVCIIEAMKVMNEIQAEVSGTIKEILVENGDTVEYGQPLFRLAK